MCRRRLANPALKAVLAREIEWTLVDELSRRAACATCRSSRHGDAPSRRLITIIRQNSFRRARDLSSPVCSPVDGDADGVGLAHDRGVQKRSRRRRRGEGACAAAPIFSLVYRRPASDPPLMRPRSRKHTQPSACGAAGGMAPLRTPCCAAMRRCRSPRPSSVRGHMKATLRPARSATRGIHRQPRGRVAFFERHLKTDAPAPQTGVAGGSPEPRCGAMVTRGRRYGPMTLSLAAPAAGSSARSRATRRRLRCGFRRHDGNEQSLDDRPAPPRRY